jgi:hypothetical protein
MAQLKYLSNETLATAGLAILPCEQMELRLAPVWLVFRRWV